MDSDPEAAAEPVAGSAVAVVSSDSTVGVTFVVVTSLEPMVELLLAVSFGESLLPVVEPVVASSSEPVIVESLPELSAIGFSVELSLSSNVEPSDVGVVLTSSVVVAVLSPVVVELLPVVAGSSVEVLVSFKPLPSSLPVDVVSGEAFCEMLSPVLALVSSSEAAASGESSEGALGTAVESSFTSSEVLPEISISMWLAEVTGWIHT